MKEFRCGCGATLEDEGVGGERSGAGLGISSEKPFVGRWVQCHSDACGIWQHAGCCEYGCAEDVQGSVPARRHWCRTCDPKGKKHAKYQDKRETKRPSHAEGTVAGTGTDSPKKLGQCPRVNCTGLDEQEELLHLRLWEAVLKGDLNAVRRTVSDADGREEGCMQRLWVAGQPSSTHRNLGGGEGSEAPAAITGRATALTPGINLLILAAGYWVHHVGLGGPAVGSASMAKAIAHDAVTLDGKAESNNDGGEGSPEDTQRVNEPEDKQAMGSEGMEAKKEAEASTPRRNSRGGAGALWTVQDAPAESAAGLDSITPSGSLGLGSEARMQVLNAVLERCTGEGILKADAEGRTATHHAAATGAAREVTLLLKEDPGRKTAFIKDTKGMTPLLVAASAGHAQTVVAILRALPMDQRAKALAATDEAAGENALHLACVDGHAKCAKALLHEEKVLESQLRPGASFCKGPKPAPARSPLVLARNSNGMTPLMAAAGCPSPECVILVLGNFSRRPFKTLKEQLSELRTQDDGGMNALHWAAGRDAAGSVQAAKILLGAERALARRRYSAHPGQLGASRWDENAMINCGECENGASPLHLAAAVSHKEMVSLLLEEGANSVTLDRRGWTPVMYADFDGRKEGAILELLQREPEKQLEALGSVLNSPDGRHHPRVVDVVMNLATVPAFFSLVNGFVRSSPGLLLTTLSFLREEPGLLDLENKRSLLQSTLTSPDFITQAALDATAQMPLYGFGFDYEERIIIRREPGEALGALLRWMEAGIQQWGKGGLVAWMRIYQPSFGFYGEPGYGPGVDREAWEAIAEDLIRPLVRAPAISASEMASQQAFEATDSVPTAAARAAASDPAGGVGVMGARASGMLLASSDESCSNGEGVSSGRGGSGEDDGGDLKRKALFVPVTGGMSSYCPRDLLEVRRDSDLPGGTAEQRKAAGCAHGRRGEKQREKQDEEADELRVFEMVGLVIGANLNWSKVLNLSLNPIVWKTILSRKVRVTDLELVDETYYRSLRQVLDMRGADQLGLSFRSLDLKHCRDEGGMNPDEDITDDNKNEYASLALESRTFGRWRRQCHAVADGLKRFVPLPLLKMFTENELGLLLAGPGEIDPEDWQRHAVFCGEASTALKGWFWSVVRSLTKEECSLMLQFATGCSRLPVGGFAALPKPFTVTTMEYDAQRPLPMAATCFFMLKLPRYPDLYSLRKNLLVAIRHGASGFEFC